ncbi:MAG: Rossman fold protein, TIGR00730 family [Deltaproteobacteria bacterium RIFCSPHIGHO2_02_FULL_40_11]|nr:MAG: Rossman fold protein, TIGR00730 family [Deltaproteobacteria bacterium RIFCSPHIGHO2_02_FULL_40_11]
MKRICVFCGSNQGNDTRFVDEAIKLGQILAQKNIALVYGGANVGLMGILADAVLNNGGSVTGVIPESLVDKEIVHTKLTKLEITKSMHSRKQLMFELSEAFIALPGGLGTLDELFEVLTWAQLGFHKKPCGILNIGGFYDNLLSHFEVLVDKGLMRAEHKGMILVSNQVEDLLSSFLEYKPPTLEKWVNKLQPSHHNTH